MEITRGKIEKPFKVVVYGPEGVGKTSFAARFPNPIFTDTEGSTAPYDVARFPRPTSWTMLLEQARHVKANPAICKTYVVDTADWAEMLCINHVCAEHKKSGLEDFGYGKGYTYLMEEFGRFLNLMEDLLEVGINVVLTAHAKMRKFEQPDELGAYDRWELKLSKQTSPLVKEWADLLLFANYKTFVVNVDGKSKAQGGTKRVMYTAHHPCWDAKNRQGLPDEISFDFMEIAHLFGNPIPAKSEPVAQMEAPAMPAPPPADDPELTIEKRDTDSFWKHPATGKYIVVPAGTLIPHDGQIIEVTKAEYDTSQAPPPAPVSEPLTPQEKKAVEATVFDPEDSIPKPLKDLMTENNVSSVEIQQAVAQRGYYPIDTPIGNYKTDFINGVLIAAWPKVFEMIQEIRK